MLFVKNLIDFGVIMIASEATKSVALYAFQTLNRKLLYLTRLKIIAFTHFRFKEGLFAHFFCFQNYYLVTFCFVHSALLLSKTFGIDCSQAHQSNLHRPRRCNHRHSQSHPLH